MSYIDNLIKTIKNRYILYNNINNFNYTSIKKNNDLDIYNYNYEINNNNITKKKIHSNATVNKLEYNKYLYDKLIKFIKEIDINNLPEDDNLDMSFKDILKSIDENIVNIQMTQRIIKENIINYIKTQRNLLLENITTNCNYSNSKMITHNINVNNNKLKQELDSNYNNIERYSIYNLFMSGGDISKTSFLIEFRIKYSKQIEELIELSQLLYNYNNFIKVMNLATQITVEHKYYRIFKQEDIMRVQNIIRQVNNNDFISIYLKKYFNLFLEILKKVFEDINLQKNQCINVSNNVFINELYVYFEMVYNLLNT